MTDNPAPYGSISNTDELGQLVRQHRKHKQLTLENVSGLANLSVRFLSEFERGKQTAEIGKVLKAIRMLGLEVIVQPRGHARVEQARTASAADRLESGTPSENTGNTKNPGKLRD